MFRLTFSASSLLAIWLGYLAANAQAQDSVQSEPEDVESTQAMHEHFYASRLACTQEYLVPYAGARVWGCPKDNGDVYVVDNSSLEDSSEDYELLTTARPRAADEVDMDAVLRECNTSFVTPRSDMMHFNATGALPDERDKTGMCYLRCFFEKSGLLQDWKLNAELVRKYVWPATGDSLEYCENEKKDEINACVRGYAIAKCVVTRALTDARNKPL